MKCFSVFPSPVLLGPGGLGSLCVAAGVASAVSPPFVLSVPSLMLVVVVVVAVAVAVIVDFAPGAWSLDSAWGPVPWFTKPTPTTITDTPAAQFHPRSSPKTRAPTNACEQYKTNKQAPGYEYIHNHFQRQAKACGIVPIFHHPPPVIDVRQCQCGPTMQYNSSYLPWQQSWPLAESQSHGELRRRSTRARNTPT